MRKFSRARRLVGIAIEASRWIDPAHRFPRLIDPTPDRPPVFIARNIASIGIETHELRGRIARDERRKPSNRAHPTFRIAEGEHALRGGIEFQNATRREPLNERAPDLRTQAVADDHAKLMRLFRLGWRLGEEIAAELPDILEKGAAFGSDVFPKGARREAFPQHDLAAVQQHCARRGDSAHTVEQGQAVIHDIVGRRVRHAGKPPGPAQHAAVTDDGGLGQPCRTAGKDV